MRWLIPVLLALTAGCGPSQAEKFRVAKVACSIMAETRNMDSAQRVERVNQIRSELGLPPYLDGDEEIKRSFKYGVCELLVLNEGWNEAINERRELLRQQVAERGFATLEELEFVGPPTISGRGTIAILVGAPFTGLVRDYYESGQLKDEWNYKDGNINGDGLRRSWYESGQLKEELNLKDGKPDGLLRFWYESGQLKEERNFKDGKLDGLRHTWTENGQPEDESNYKDGEREGLWRSWNENGQLNFENNYKDGKEHGLSRFWFKNGKLWSERNYKDGKRHGLSRSWYENGQRHLEVNYKDGKEHGLSRSWNEDGQPWRGIEYKDGRALYLQ
jgi:antitoxin component YwqK of YwqJK toxin-antitoxin module